VDKGNGGCLIQWVVKKVVKEDLQERLSVDWHINLSTLGVPTPLLFSKMFV
jgi:hypothetical protein